MSAVIASGFPEQRYQCLTWLVAQVGGRDTDHGSLGDADLPSLAEAREALALVERGAPVASATATWPRSVAR